jgi:hypothetical protein
MFEVQIEGESGFTSDLTVDIQGCPANGLAAIDFRRSHGLPDAPDDSISLPAGRWVSEEACRSLPPEWLDANANAHPNNLKLKRWICSMEGKVWEETYHYPLASPGAIKAYLDNPGAETAAALLRDLHECRNRNRAAAQARAEAIHRRREDEARRIAEARELLANELRLKDEEIAYLKGEIKSLKEELADARPELAE